MRRYSGKYRERKGCMLWYADQIGIIAPLSSRPDIRICELIDKDMRHKRRGRWPKPALPLAQDQSVTACLSLAVALGEPDLCPFIQPMPQAGRTPFDTAADTFQKLRIGHVEIGPSPAVRGDILHHGLRPIQ